MQLHVLVLDDDPALLNALNEVTLENRQFTFVHAANHKTGLNLLKQESFDLVLLNPKVNGTSGDGAIRSIRAESDIPLMAVCENSTEEEKAFYVDAGADACLAKPLCILEMKTRAKALYRRVYKNARADEISFGPIQMNLKDFTVTKAGKSVNLTKTEFAILKLLVQEPKRVFTKSELYKKVWELGGTNNGNIINVHIRRMRLKLEDDPNDPKVIVTRWGFGYQIGLN